MVDAPKLSELNYLLMSLLWIEPRSGYDLRKLFRDSPLARFSASPGSIYPALRKLHEQGLTREAEDNGNGRRARTVFELTGYGVDTVRDWLSAPIDDADVRRRPDLVSLRVALLTDVGSPEEVQLRLDEFASAVQAQIQFYSDNLSMPGRPDRAGGRRALELALDVWSVRANWARRLSASLGANASSES